MTDPINRPALDQLGDSLEQAVARSVAAGGVPPERGRRGHLTLLVCLVAFVALALGAVAVIPDAGRSAEAEVRAAAQQTVDASTGRFEVTMAVTGAALTPDFEAVVTGAYDIPQDRFQTAVDLSSLVDGLAAEGLDLLGGDATVTLVVDGTTVYLRIGLLGALPGTDAEWIRLDLGELTGGSGLFGDAAAPMGAGTLDPSAFLEMLEGFGGEVTEAGNESVRGAETTRYSGSIDLDVAYQQLPPEERAEIEQVLGALVPGGLDLPSFPVDVWIDEAGLVRRFETRVSLGDVAPLGSEVAAGEVSLRLEYFDLGQPVDVTVPGPEETVELGEVLDGVGLGFLGDIDLEALREAMEGFEGPDLGELGEHLDELDLEGVQQHLDGLTEHLGGGESQGSGDS